MAGGIAVGITLRGLAAIDNEVVDTRGQSPCNSSSTAHTGDSPHVSESGACSAAVVADGRYQCVVVVACGNRAGFGAGLYPSVRKMLVA